MKPTLYLLSLGALATSVLGGPPGARDASTIYKLKLVSNTTSLDGQYLSTNGSAVGVYGGGAPLQVYTLPASPARDAGGAVELHTYPIGIVDHALGLVGTGGLLQLADLTNPAAASPSPPAGTTYDYTSFSLVQPGPGGSGAAAGGDADTGGARLAYKGVEDGWVAFPGADDSWEVDFYDGQAIIIQDYVHVEIELETV